MKTHKDKINDFVPNPAMVKQLQTKIEAKNRIKFGSTEKEKQQQADDKAIMNIEKVFGKGITQKDKPKQKSDMKRFIELYKSFEIDLKPVKYPDGDYDIALDETVSNKFGGYSGFGSGVIFDKDGKFIKQGFYE